MIIFYKDPFTQESVQVGEMQEDELAVLRKVNDLNQLQKIRGAIYAKPSDDLRKELGAIRWWECSLPRSGKGLH